MATRDGKAREIKEAARVSGPGASMAASIPALQRELAAQKVRIDDIEKRLKKLEG